MRGLHYGPYYSPGHRVDGTKSLDPDMLQFCDLYPLARESNPLNCR